MPTDSNRVLMDLFEEQQKLIEEQGDQNAGRACRLLGSVQVLTPGYSCFASAVGFQHLEPTDFHLVQGGIEWTAVHSLAGFLRIDEQVSSWKDVGHPDLTILQEAAWRYQRNCVELEANYGKYGQSYAICLPSPFAPYAIEGLCFLDLLSKGARDRATLTYFCPWARGAFGRIRNWVIGLA